MVWIKLAEDRSQSVRYAVVNANGYLKSITTGLP
jgi:hypothetical protein